MVVNKNTIGNEKEIDGTPLIAGKVNFCTDLKKIQIDNINLVETPKIRVPLDKIRDTRLIFEDLLSLIFDDKCNVIEKSKALYKKCPDHRGYGNIFIANKKKK